MDSCRRSHCSKSFLQQNRDVLDCKGSSCFRGKIVKVSFPGVAVCGSCGMLESRCGAVALWGVAVWGVAVWESCGVWELQRGGVAA